MKQILLTNDDGFESKGLLALKEALSPLGKVLVVAPAREKSACGHGLSITKPLSLVSVGEDFYKLDDGTPTDCVYLALNSLYSPRIRPDLIVSGINIGCNRRGCHLLWHGRGRDGGRDTWHPKHRDIPASAQRGRFEGLRF